MLNCIIFHHSTFSLGFSYFDSYESTTTALKVGSIEGAKFDCSIELDWSRGVKKNRVTEKTEKTDGKLTGKTEPR